MRILVAAVLVVLLPVVAEAESWLLFLDGARIQRDVPVRNGYLEFSVPEAMVANSLRIKPLGAGTIIRVDSLPSAGATSDRTSATLQGKCDALRDRLRVLADREVIFRAAAKSQSGRALRRTKTNPEPLELVRTGTWFALGNLEAVQNQQRRLERELAALESSLNSGGGTAGGRIVKVWLSPAGRSVRVTYLVKGQGWQPRYEFRLAGTGKAETLVRAKLPPVPANAAAAVVPWSIADGLRSDFSPWPVSADHAVVASYHLPLQGEELMRGAVPTLSLTLDTASGTVLPPGPADGYWQGEYLGTVTFPGSRTPGPLPLVFGR